MSVLGNHNNLNTTKQDHNHEPSETPDELRELTQMELAVESEKQDNQTEQERMSRKPVTYGLTVQLLHSMTNMFLTVSSEDAAHVDMTTMQVGVRPNSSKRTFSVVVAVML